jgi:ectoine hydroxylase-related dioxygenase (phytanoyl-CoA dioxygenase family)
MSHTAVDQAVVDESLSEIRETGFCVVPNVISRSVCQQWRDALVPLALAERGANERPNGHQRVLHLLVKSSIFLEPLTHPLVLSVLRRYLGEDMICSSFSANILWPGCSEQYWHVDHPYWTMTQPYPLEMPLGGHALWMLDDFTFENGATAGIPGSHKRPGLPELGARWADDARVLVGEQGSVILADAAWWHTSRPNTTQGMRPALLAKYTRTFCVPQEDMRLQLQELKDPDPVVRQLLGGHQYVPTRGFPY